MARAKPCAVCRIENRGSIKAMIHIHCLGSMTFALHAARQALMRPGGPQMGPKGKDALLIRAIDNALEPR